MEGPKRRYLERQATYQLSVTNPGTAPAKQVELVASLPAGLKFVRANNAGYYEESTRTVRWRLEELPANETGSVELVTMPVEAGQHAIKLRGTAQKGLTAEKEQPVLIEGLAAILFQVAKTADPIEVGGETTYEVHVVNQGSKAAGNVRLSIDLPPELKPVAAEGPTRYCVEGERVVFDGLAQLAPKADTTLSPPRQSPEARRPSRPLPTADRRHADPGHERREHAGVCGRMTPGAVTTSTPFSRRACTSGFVILSGVVCGRAADGSAATPLVLNQSEMEIPVRSGCI